MSRGRTTLKRDCASCGCEVKEVAKLMKGSLRGSRKVRRFKCLGCGLESSTTLTVEEVQEAARKDRQKELLDRVEQKY